MRKSSRGKESGHGQVGVGAAVRTERGVANGAGRSDGDSQAYKKKPARNRLAREAISTLLAPHTTNPARPFPYRHSTTIRHLSFNARLSVTREYTNPPP